MQFEAKLKGKSSLSSAERVRFEGVHLRGEDFSGKKYQHFSTVGCRFEGCRFSDTRIVHAAFGVGQKPSEFIECIFDKMQVQHMSGGPSRYVRCSFINVDICDWFAFKVELISCMFSGRLRKSVFNGRVPVESQSLLGRQYNEIRDNDFSEMEFVDVDFRTGVDLTLQRLPSGRDYLYLIDPISALHVARAELLSWSNLKVRQVALVLIGNLQRAVEDGQRQLLLRRSDYDDYSSSLPPDAVKVVFDLLRKGVRTDAPL